MCNTKRKYAIKAALLSALVFPGAGHLMLKKYLKSLAFICVVGAILVVLMVRAVDIAYAIQRDMLGGNARFESPQDLMHEISVRSQAARSTGVDVASFVVFILWVLAIIDSYRLGRKLEEGCSR